MADEDPRVAREREMLHRTQEALRQSQADNAELSKGKLEVEEKLKAATDQIEANRRTAKIAQNSLQTQQQAATSAQNTIAELTRKLDDATAQVATLNSKQRDTTVQLTQRESEFKRVQQDLAASRTQGASCEAKNLKLYEYSQALLEQYRRKGVWAALAQKEPVTGIKEVRIENVVQEYQQKLDSQKLPQAAPH